MVEEIGLQVTITFIKVMTPIVTVLAIVLFLKPSLFMNLEKKLSLELGSKKVSRKTIEVLEKENMLLQNILLQYNRIVGLIIFVFSIVVLWRLYL